MNREPILEEQTLIEQKYARFQDKIEKARANAKQETTFNEILGYMPLRRDFDYEYDNEAELFLAEMEFNDDDLPDEIELKRKIFEIYNKRLNERIRRKDFVIDRGLLDLKKQNHLDRTRSAEEKEIYNLMKIFARFQTEEEHDRLVQNIVKERALRRRIEELKAYKELNLKTFEEVEQFLLEKRKKDNQYNKRAETLKNIYQPDNKVNMRKHRNKQEEEELKDSKIPFTELENRLCDRVGLKPHEYLLIKEILVRESVSQGFLSREFVNNIFDSKRTDKNKIIEVFDFLVNNDLVLEK